MPKWNKRTQDFTPGDIVLLKEENFARNQWPLGVVDDITKSNDGLVRKVRVRVADTQIDKKGIRTRRQSVLERPIHKCVRLIESPKRDHSKLPGDSPTEEPKCDTLIN